MPTMEERTRHGRLDRESASEVIRRAAELDAGRFEDPGGIDRRALQEAADEVGISEAAVRRALAEHDAGALVQAPDRSLLGPAHALSVRVVPLPRTTAAQRVDRFLRGQMLEVKERRGDEVVWCRRTDLAAKLRRKVDLNKRVRLDGVDEIIACVADAGDGHSLVRLEASLEHTRRGLITGVAVLPAGAAPVAGALLTVVTKDLFWLVGGVPAGVALGGAGLYAGRRTLAGEREDARRALELQLDELERGR